MELRGGCMHYPKQKDTWRDDYATGISAHLFKGFKKGSIMTDVPVKRPEGE